MRPAIPAAGDEVLASWAGDVIDFIGAGWRYVPIERATLLNSATGLTAEQTLEVTAIPANDPNVVAAEIHIMVRNSSESTTTMTVRHFSGGDALAGYSSGYTGRGGSSDTGPVLVGGVNNRQIKWLAGHTTATVWMYCAGYWVRESVEPVVGSSDPIGTTADPLLPTPGSDLTVEWAASLIAKAAKGWRYVPVPRGYNTSPPIAQTAGVTTHQAIELTTLPVDDPRVVAAAVDVIIRTDSAIDGWVSIADYDGTGAGHVYSNGVAQKYAISGPYIVFVGGVNNRQIKWRANAATSLAWVSPVGYWIAED
jgi:hypothetical protein